MKQLTLKIDDKLYEAIKNNLAIRKMCDAGAGLLFELNMRIVSAIEKGEEELELSFK